MSPDETTPNAIAVHNAKPFFCKNYEAVVTSIEILCDANCESASAKKDINRMSDVTKNV